MKTRVTHKMIFGTMKIIIKLKLFARQRASWFLFYYKINKSKWLVHLVIVFWVQFETLCSLIFIQLFYLRENFLRISFLEYLNFWAVFLLSRLLLLNISSNDAGVNQWTLIVWLDMLLRNWALHPVPIIVNFWSVNHFLT